MNIFCTYWYFLCLKFFCHKNISAKVEHKMMVEIDLRCHFHQPLMSNFLCKSVTPSFFALTFCVCSFLAKENWCKAGHKLIDVID